MIKCDKNQPTEIIQEVKSNLGKDILLCYESKLYLAKKLVDSYYSFLCDQKRKLGPGWICGTGLSNRKDRGARALCHLEDIDVLILSFEVKLLDDEILYSELKQKYSIEESRKYDVFNVLMKKTPRPFFHASLDIDNE